MQLSLLPSPTSTVTIAGAKWPESATKDRKFPSLVLGLQHSDTAFIITSDTLLAQVLPAHFMFDRFYAQTRALNEVLIEAKAGEGPGGKELDIYYDSISV